ncbi:MAG TPA: glycosyltransferase family 39 protein [Candidatus Binataceae bacterium]|nr:glycosyltransferase family 39 protein [Candidatus Binataceae bacterium]
MNNAASGATGPSLSPEPPAAPSGGAAAGSRGLAWFSDLAEPPLAIIVLTLVGAALFLVNLGGYPFYTKGEPREAVTVFDMLHGGGFILPLRAGVEIPSKPLLMHWLAAIISILAGGVSEWTVRMPSGLFAVGGMLAAYLYLRRLFDDRIGFLAALMLGTTVQYLQAGSGARVDMTLTFFLEVAFFEFILIAEGLTARRMTLYFAIAMAVLSKGPVGLVLPGLVALVWIAIEGRWQLLGELRLVRGAALVTLLAGGWYLAAALTAGMPFVHKQLLAENLFRFVRDSAFHEGHAHPFYYMEGALIGGFMPWTPLLLIVFVQAARRPHLMGRRLSYLMVWFVVVLLFYNLPQSKRGVYLLALYPALAALLAIYVEAAARVPDVSRHLIRWLSLLAAVFFALAGLDALLGLGMLAFAPRALELVLRNLIITDYDFVPQLNLAAAAHPFIGMGLGVAMIAIGVLAIRGRQSAERLCAAVTGGTICLALAANLFVVPALANALTLEPFTHEAMNIVGTHSVGYMGALNYDVAYYSERNLPVVSIWSGPRPDFLIAWREEFLRLPPSMRAQFRAVLLSHPTELDGSGGMVLLQCEPGHAPELPGAPSVEPPSRGEPPKFDV